MPRFAGERLEAPDDTAAWGITRQIAGGEYRLENLTPQAGWMVIDIGANIGVYSLWAARRGATVTAYEPSPDTFACLKANVARKTIKPVNAAVVGTPRERARLYLHDERSTRHTLMGREIETGGELMRFVDVPAVTLAEAIGDGCDLLKVDCEGGEFEMFANTRLDALARAKRVVLEFHRSVGDPETLVEHLRQAGFRWTAVVAGADAAEPFGIIGARR